MAYDENLAQRVREQLSPQRALEEKAMMGGLTFMVNGKMCVGIFHDDLMCRIDKRDHAAAVERPGCRTMKFSNRAMPGFVLVDQTALRTARELRTWIDLALSYNKIAKASAKPKRKRS